MQQTIRIGTRESQLAVWQATQVKNILDSKGYTTELVYIKSEGDIDLSTPLYEMGVQGVFTRSLDIAMLSNRIDIAVHSMKDVPTQLPKGIIQSAAMKRGPYRDLIVYKNNTDFLEDKNSEGNIATSSVRRIAQWLNRYPKHKVHNLRGNVNTRLRKLSEENWNGAIFAQAGLERINLRPESSIELNWMLPAPAQGAIMVVCRDNEPSVFEACQNLNDYHTQICTKAERDFLRTLMGGCSTPISALAEIENEKIIFTGNILSTDGKDKTEVNCEVSIEEAEGLGERMAMEILKNGGQKIVDGMNK
jgi:hydroxymethylbilane synthase